MLKLLPLFILSATLAAAQDTAPTLGDVTIPTSDWVILSALIGWLVKEIASPLTALLKKRYGFTGNVTQAIYALLTLLITLGYGLANDGFGHGANGWVNGVTLFLVALVKGYGDYTKQQQAAASVQGGEQ